MCVRVSPACPSCGRMRTCAVIEPCHRFLKRTRLLDTTHAWRLLSQRTSLVGRVLAERANAGELNI